MSHQAVYRHLKNCLKASKDDEQTLEERRETARNTVYALQQRTEIVTESTIETLRSAGVTDSLYVEVLVNSQVVCSDYGQSMDLETTINGECNCNTS